jgi:hypothetical protein
MGKENYFKVSTLYLTLYLVRNSDVMWRAVTKRGKKEGNQYLPNH